MGYDIFPILTMPGTVMGTQEAILDEIDTALGISFAFDEEEGRHYAEEVRWSSMEDDMCDFSEKYPLVTFNVRYQGEDGTEYSLWVNNGQSYEDSQSDWVPPPFDASKLL